MTSTEIRQSFLDFFQSKQHTIVRSSSLMPDSPNLLFTNAGMNQFVPIFLGQTKCPYTPGRAADTQKCIRAGGKHNDLEDVGLDTYHHTFFEMLGNWSFGDYFKKDAIAWAWELVIEVWKFPPQRLYATIYNPDKANGDPSERDEEAWNFWAEKFRSVGLDPAVHIVNGNKKDNFWMMGETGPCGPCSELHVDLTPQGDTRGALVNKGSAECIEIWNLVFMQFNANPDGTYSPLPAKSVDTGMGFERVTGIIQNTKNFTDFTRVISNYETDIFRPLFDKLEKLSGKKYGATLPSSSSTGFQPVAVEQASSLSPGQAAGSAGRMPALLHRQDACATTGQIQIDIAFRVIADHIRTLSFAIADGIQPGNTDRNYVLRRILRRAVRYGRTLGFHEPFFYKLVDVLADTMGDVFPEIRAKKNHVEEVIQREEEAFNKTLDTGLALFERLSKELLVNSALKGTTDSKTVELTGNLLKLVEEVKSMTFDDTSRSVKNINPTWKAEWIGAFPSESAFLLYDTYGFPLDLTELMARERGLTVDVAGFDKLMEEQKARARAAQKKTVIELSQIETQTPTAFVGYDKLETPAKVLEVVQLKDKTAVILDTSACYAEMGGQVGDTGELSGSGQLWRITNTQKSGNTWLHLLDDGGAHAPSRVPDRALAVGTDARHRASPPRAEADAADEASAAAREARALPIPGNIVTLFVDRARRNAIQRHHTVTHLLHWALHEVVSNDASQKGSFVGPDKLTFDFNHAPLTPQQVADVEKLVNERILENAPVSWTEIKYDHVKGRPDVMQFFGDKYGECVRVVQIGGKPTGLDGYSMELCGGTHTRATGEIGLFRITGENAIAAGVRRIEAIAGLTAYDVARLDRELIRTVAGKVNSPVGELEKKIESLLEQQKALEKQLKAMQQKEAAGAAKDLLAKAATLNGVPAIIERFDADGDTLQGMVNELKGQFKGVIVLGGAANSAVALIAAVSPEFTAKVQAGKVIQQIAPIVGGKGGGKPDAARGGGKDVAKLDEALAKAKSLLG